MAKEIEKTKKTKCSFRPANQQGSILAFSLIIMFVLMIIAVGVATVSVKERKMSSDTGKSITAYQAADSGAEVVLKAIIKDGQTSVNALDAGGMICAGGVISGSAPSGTYELTFEDAGGLIINCSDMDTIEKIKSVGKYSGTNRAVEVDL